VTKRWFLLHATSSRVETSTKQRTHSITVLGRKTMITIKKLLGQEDHGILASLLGALSLIHWEMAARTMAKSLILDPPSSTEQNSHQRCFPLLHNNNRIVQDMPSRHNISKITAACSKFSTISFDSAKDQTLGFRYRRLDPES
jgi:hypothetical protein